MISIPTLVNCDVVDIESFVESDECRHVSVTLHPFLPHSEHRDSDDMSLRAAS